MDPVLVWSGRLALAVLFGRAAVHKLRDRERFDAVLADYRVLPRAAVKAAARGLVAAELATAAALLLPGAGAAGALGAAGLLAVYSAAIGVNLARGRREIDCGCGGPAERPLGPGLLARNALLMGIAVAAAPGPAPRDFVWIDVLTVALALGTVVLLWHAAGRLATFPFPWLPLRRRMHP